MNRVTRGSVVLAAALVAMSCEGDPTGDLRNGGDHLVATPSAIFLTSGASNTVLIEVVDEQGNRLESSFNLGNVDAGLTVVEDTAYNNVYNNKGELVKPSKWTRAQYIVTATANTGDLTWAVSAGGVDSTFSVRILPTNVALATLSNATPNLGDTVTVTAPAPFKFTPASVVSAGAAALVQLALSADSSSISFIPGPNANSPVSVTGTVLDYAPTAATYVLSSAATLVSPAVATIGTLSATTIALGDTVTINVAAGALRIPPAATASFAGITAVTIGIATDSLSMSVVVPPGTTAPITVNGAILNFLPGVPLNLPTSDNLTITGTNFPAHDTPGSTTLGVGPAVGDTLEFFDTSDAIDQFYQLDAPAGSIYQIRLSWPGTGAAPDIDILVYNAGVTGFVCGFGGATGSLPENLTCNFSAAVTPTTVHISANVYAGSNPAYYRWRLIRTQ